MNFTLKIQLHVNARVKIFSNVAQKHFLTRKRANVKGEAAKFLNNFFKNKL